MACSTGSAPPPESPTTGVFREALANEPQVRWAAVPTEPLQFAWPQQGGVLVVDAQWRLPDGPWPEPVRQQLLAFLQQGGRAVLFGHAAGLAADLGIEPQAPQRREFRWGYDARAVQGSALVGLHVVSGQLPELVDGLPPNSGSEDVWFLAGDAPCTAPLCTWSVAVPERGVVLARLASRRDGADDAAGAPVLVHWPVGKGALLACGLVPRLDHPDAAVAGAAKAFVQRCAKWAGNGQGLTVLVEGDRAPAPAEVVLPRMAPLVPHWGWRTGWQADGEDRIVADLVRESLEPGWLAGADLCELDLAGADGSVPLAWRPEDPLKPAPSFESRPDGRHFDGAAFREVCAEAHLRSMLAFASLDPLPVGERAAERLATLRFLARELACVRRFGAGAFDGFGVRRWLADRDGLSLAMLGDFAPAAVFYRTGELGGDVAGALRAVDAQDGALPGLPYCGLSATWRAGFAPDRFPLGVLDARSRIAGDGELGACSSGDWIVQQANDFVRARVGQGAAMWWRRHAEATLDRDTEAYVHGVSLEPLRAAVATGLAATGQNGLRAAAAALVPDAPAAFAATIDAPAAVHVLQNNWFRLLGSGGAFEFDPRGRAEFGAAAQRLATGFVRTRLFGGRPDGNALRSDYTDLLAAGTRGEGGYGRTARVGGSAGAEASSPAMLAFAQAPTWPAAVAYEWAAPVGCHELELQLRPVRGQGVLQVTLDGVVLAAAPFAEGVRPEPLRVPVHVARGGLRLLGLSLVHGGSVALDRATLRRVGDVGVEATAEVPAGNRAVLVESSQSSYHHETVRFTTVADFPGFVLATRCERAVRNLQVERSLVLPAYGELAAITSGDDRKALRQPFVLRAADPSLPDLVVAPLQLMRHESFVVQNGAVVWKGPAETGAQSRVGVLLCAHGQGARWLADAAAVLEAVSL
ncbi:MAG: hypothetical protein JNK15_15705, partial [Planctomycetes bacterium]|nr:hypothetical protein [Planctomycetota bacterium]